MGGRGLLDIPDVVDFGKVSVKYLKTMPTPVFNVGTKTARFTMTTDG
jgi:hypothetical protein